MWLLFVLLFVLATGSCGVRPLPIVEAARSGNISAIRQLVNAGESPNRPAGINDWTPLMHAIHKDQGEAVVALADLGADVNLPTRSGLTPLMMASGYGQANIVQALLAKGANPKATDQDGRTALDAAITGVGDIDKWTLGECQGDVVALLVKAAADLRPHSRLAAKWTGCAERLARR